MRRDTLAVKKLDSQGYTPFPASQSCRFGLPGGGVTANVGRTNLESLACFLRPYKLAKPLRQGPARMRLARMSRSPSQLNPNPAPSQSHSNSHLNFYSQSHPRSSLLARIPKLPNSQSPNLHHPNLKRKQQERKKVKSHTDHYYKP